MGRRYDRGGLSSGQAGGGWGGGELQGEAGWNMGDAPGYDRLDDDFGQSRSSKWQFEGRMIGGLDAHNGDSNNMIGEPAPLV